METGILARAIGSKTAYEIWKNDVGSGQAGDPHYTIDLHSRISQLLGGVTKGDIEVAKLGTPTDATAAAEVAKRKNKKVKATKPKKPPNLPQLKALAGMPGPLQDLYNTLTGLDTASQGLIGWQGYVDNLHGGPSDAVPLVTLADGVTQVVNWDGMTDPQTGTWDKGINQRLAEIGAPGNLDINTELGIDDQLLLDYFKMQGLAPQVMAGFTPWVAEMNAEVGIEGAEINWLDHVLDPQWPLSQVGEPKWPADRFASMLLGTEKVHWPGHHSMTWSRTEPFATWIKNYVAKYKNLLASKKRWTEIRADLAQRKAAIEAKMTDGFDTARHNLATGGMTGTADAAQVLRDSLAALAAGKTKALSYIPGAPPASWLGDPAAWYQQTAAEKAQVTNEFAARELAIKDAAAKASLARGIKKSDALFFLDQRERDEKAALIQSFDTQRRTLDGQITNAGTTTSGERTYLSGLKTKIGTEQTADKQTIADATTGTIGQNLAAYLLPAQQGGQLAINALTMANITIPAVLAEIAALKGTTLPTTPAGGGLTQTQSELLALTQQQLANAGQALAVSQLQYGAFNSLFSAPLPGFASGGLPPLPPFGGSFAEGGIVPGPIGAARSVIAHGGEIITPPGAGMGTPDVHLHQHFNKGSEWLRTFVDARVTATTRTAARKAMSSTPGRGGGQLLGR